MKYFIFGTETLNDFQTILYTALKVCGIALLICLSYLVIYHCFINPESRIRQWFSWQITKRTKYYKNWLINNPDVWEYPDKPKI